MKIKIERGIPIPESYTRSKDWDFLESMKVGDSFAVPILKMQSVRMILCQRVRRGLKAKFKTRSVGDQLRVWRVA